MEPVDTDETLRMRRAPAGGVAPGGDGPTQPLPPADGRRRPSTPAGPHDAAPARPDAPPRLAEGVELLGRMEDSGYKEPPFMARRADGQMIQLAPILYLVAERADGRRSYDQIGAEVSQMIGRGLDGDAVRMLAEEKLRPLGVLAAADGSSLDVQKVDPLLGLKLNTAVIPPRAVRASTTIFHPFFLPPVMLLVLATFFSFDL